MTQLLDLPIELLSSLPTYLRNIEDFTNASSSCRTLRGAFAPTHPNTILRLAAASAPTFFSPHPHYLVMATARQVSDWAVGDEAKTAELHTAFQGGIDGLYDLCVDKAGITMQEIRRLHRARFDIINPLSDKIDKMAGQQWYQTPDFWDGGVSEPNTLYTVADRAAFQLIIYGELFGGTVQAYLAPGLNLPKMGRLTRLEYVKYCSPDWACPPGYGKFEVLRVGPYSRDGGTGCRDADQYALRHTLTCGRWERMWNAVTRQIAPDMHDGWRQRAWFNSVQLQGLRWMELVTTEAEAGHLSSDWRVRLTEVRRQVEALERTELPVNERPPNLANELEICCAAMWAGHTAERRELLFNGQVETLLASP